MIELCEILGIGINELFYGEMINMNETNKKYDEIILAMKKEQEENDKPEEVEVEEIIVSDSGEVTIVISGEKVSNSPSGE